MQVLIRLYQRTLGTLWNCCRFYPSCSEYALEAFERHNWFKALWLTLRRLVKCGPWHPGGCDPCP